MMIRLAAKRHTFRFLSPIAIGKKECLRRLPCFALAIHAHIITIITDESK